jgi:hypothetical protein
MNYGERFPPLFLLAPPREYGLVGDRTWENELMVCSGCIGHHPSFPVLHSKRSEFPGGSESDIKLEGKCFEHSSEPRSCFECGNALAKEAPRNIGIRGVLNTPKVISWRELIMARKRAKEGSCSVFGCTNEHKSIFLVPSSEPLKNQWVDFIFSGNAARVCAKHFTEDCFLNLGQYRAGLAQRLRIDSRSVPTLLGSATNRRQVSKLLN